MRSAIIHDWVVSNVGGGERALEAIHRLFPSPIYTLIRSKKNLEGTYFQDIPMISSFIQKFPRAEKSFRNYLPFFPLAIEQFDLSAFDLILSSSHCVSKGIISHPNQLHICYCHTPMRYAWDLMHDYLKESGLDRGFKGAIARWIFHYLRGWDVQSSNRVDHFVANSHYVARRIQKYYARKADVIHPPVDIAFFSLLERKDNYYVTASRFVPYKKIPMIIEAFSKMPDLKLVVIGDGPEWKRAKEIAGKNIELLGYQPNSVLREYIQRAKAFVFAAVEDFGILPVEAMACGTPIIAYGKGGICETVIEGETGLFFDEQSVDSLIGKIRQFEKTSLDPKLCRKRAESFSQEEFNRQFKTFVLEKYSEFLNCSKK